MLPRKAMSAPLASSLSRRENSFTSFPARAANLAGSWYIFVMSCEKAVAEVSSCCIFSSSTAAKPMIWACVSPACLPTPATRAVNSSRYPAPAEEFCESSLITEAVASIAPLRPRRWSSSKSMASLPTFLTAPSPRSSPRATLILSAASTKSSICFLEVIPSLPASPASALSCSREVRVSIFLRLSLRSSIASAESPVYLRTCAFASSMSA